MDFMRKDYAFVEVGREGSTLKTIKQDVCVCGFLFFFLLLFMLSFIQISLIVCWFFSSSFSSCLFSPSLRMYLAWFFLCVLLGKQVVYVAEEKKPSQLLQIMKINPNATCLVFTHTKRAGIHTFIHSYL